MTYSMESVVASLALHDRRLVQHTTINRLVIGSLLISCLFLFCDQLSDLSISSAVSFAGRCTIISIGKAVGDKDFDPCHDVHMAATAKSPWLAPRVIDKCYMKTESTSIYNITKRELRSVA